MVPVFLIIKYTHNLRAVDFIENVSRKNGKVNKCHKRHISRDLQENDIGINGNLVFLFFNVYF